MLGRARGKNQIDFKITTTDPKMQTSKLIKSIRLSQNLNQTEFAKKIGVAQNRISEWENGKKSIRFDRAMEICEIFDVDLCKLSKK